MYESMTWNTLKTIVLTGIDSVGKTSAAKFIQEKYKNVVVRKYPNDKDIIMNINNYYDRIVNGGKELHQETITNMYKQIHDLYDRDFRMPFSVPEDTEILLFDRYFIDNVVYSRLNGVERTSYSEGHFVIPDIVIFLKARDYMGWKKTFKLKGDENIREPAVLFHEVQPEFQDVLKKMQLTKKIMRYTLVEALVKDTNENIMEIINSL